MCAIKCGVAGRGVLHLTLCMCPHAVVCVTCIVFVFFYPMARSCMQVST